LNLFAAGATYCCLGYCIARGISLRRQATIFRLRGAARCGRSASHQAIGFPPIPDSSSACAVTRLLAPPALLYKFSRDGIVFLAFGPASGPQDLQNYAPVTSSGARCRRTGQQCALLNKWNFSIPPALMHAACGRIPVNHKGVEYTLTRSETPGVWKWQFRIGDFVRSGRTEARLLLLAMRRVQLKIDRELKRHERHLTS
jgi:hypothetical protein